MDKVFILQHEYELTKVDIGEPKLLGIYSSHHLAEEAIERYMKLPGFRNTPKECFNIDVYEIDKDSGWREGYERVVHDVNEYNQFKSSIKEWLSQSDMSDFDGRYDDAITDLYCAIPNPVDVDVLAETISEIWLLRFQEDIKEEESLNLARRILDADLPKEQ